MPNQPFFPKSEPLQIPWCNNYSTKIAIHGPTCGESAGAITAAQADLAYYVWVIEKWHPLVKADGEEATAYKRLIASGGTPGMSAVAAPVGTVFTGPLAPPALVAPGALTRLFDQIGRMKASTGFKANPDVIGQDMKIIGAADTTEHLFPEFKVKVQDGPTCQCPRIDFTKFGRKAVLIQSRINGGPWGSPAIDMESPFLDERGLLVAGQAESREYRLAFWDDGQDGDWSPVQKVTVGP